MWIAFCGIACLLSSVDPNLEQIGKCDSFGSNRKSALISYPNLQENIINDRECSAGYSYTFFGQMYTHLHNVHSKTKDVLLVGLTGVATHLIMILCNVVQFGENLCQTCFVRLHFAGS